MRFYLVLLLVFLGFSAGASDKKPDQPGYPVSQIPENLMHDAHAVIRLQEIEVEILSESRFIHRYKEVITVLDKKADFLGMVYEFYDDMTKITEMSAKVYDKNGKEVLKLKRSDISDESAISGFSLYEDTRVKYADLSQNNYPYTVEAVIETSNAYLYVLPRYVVQNHENVSVQESSYTVSAPASLAPRYKELNFEGHREEKTEGGNIQISWTFANLEAAERESYGLTMADKSPKVFIAPSKFEYSGYSGSMESWSSYGQWLGKLNADRNTLPEETAQKLKKLTHGMSDMEKAEFIYKYMQNRTRYVSIQMGIGGLQPFKSGLVDEVGYGDCKALSYYTKSMLEAVGVKANYTLVSSGKNYETLYDDFPTDVFDHVILAVPMEQDTVWLECTSQTQPFNFLGSFTDDRKVLMITDDGAAVVKTPKYDKSKNHQVRTAAVTVDAEGLAKAEIHTRFTGLQTENGGLDRDVNLGQKEQKDWVYNTTRIPHYELEAIAMTEGMSDMPFIDVDMTLKLPKFTSQSGKRIFFQPNLMNRRGNPLKKDENRTDPVTFSFGFVDVDSIVYTFPSSLRMEYIPEAVTIETEYGKYSSKMEFIQGQLIYVRRLEMNGGEYPAENYEEIRQFFNRISREDKKKVVLLKGT